MQLGNRALGIERDEGDRTARGLARRLRRLEACTTTQAGSLCYFDGLR